MVGICLGPCLASATSSPIRDQDGGLFSAAKKPNCRLESRDKYKDKYNDKYKELKEEYAHKKLLRNSLSGHAQETPYDEKR